MNRFSRIRAVSLRYFFVLRKGPQQLSDLLYWPLIDIFLWGLTSVWIASQHPSEDLPLMLMTGLIFWGVVWRGAIDISVGLLQEFWHRNLLNLFATPLSLFEWGVGVILVSLFKLVLTLTFSASMVYLLYGLNVFTVGWVFLPSALLLVVFGWTLGFLAASLIIYWGQAVESLAWMIGYVFAPFSAVFYPVAVLPLWAQNIGWALPTTYLFEGMRSVLEGKGWPSSFFLLSSVLTVVYFGAVLLLFRWRFQKSREKGLARLE